MDVRYIGTKYVQQNSFAVVIMQKSSSLTSFYKPWPTRCWRYYGIKMNRTETDNDVDNYGDNDVNHW